MTWETFRLIAAALFVVFAAVLIVVPVAQIVRGRLALHHVWGFVLAGAGFALLAIGVVQVPDPRGQALIIGGVILTVIGNLAQQRITRRLTGRTRR